MAVPPEMQQMAAESDLGSDLLAVAARMYHLASQRGKTPLTAAQARMLGAIEAHDEARIRDLAAVDHCSQPTTTVQIRRLEDLGLVRRAADTGDARSFRIGITAKGIRALRADKADRAAVVVPLLAQLETEDLQLLEDAVKVLQRLVDVSAAMAR